MLQVLINVVSQKVQFFQEFKNIHIKQFKYFPLSYSSIEKDHPKSHFFAKLLQCFCLQSFTCIKRWITIVFMLQLYFTGNGNYFVNYYHTFLSSKKSEKPLQYFWCYVTSRESKHVIIQQQYVVYFLLHTQKSSLFNKCKNR